MTLDEFGRRLDRLSTGGLAQALRPVLAQGALQIEARAKQNAGTLLHVHTGRLRSSISAAVESRAGDVVIVARAGGGTGRGVVRYARMQELGGVQVPRTAKMLRIPLPPALTAAGVDRFPTPLRQSAPGLFYLRKSAGGSLLLCNRKDDVPWYVLKHSVRIPPRPYLRPAVETVARDNIGPALARATVAAVRGA